MEAEVTLARCFEVGVPWSRAQCILYVEAPAQELDNR